MSDELRASMRIVGFETRYVPIDSSKADLGTKEVDYVITSPRGFGKFTETPMRVVDVQRMTNGMWDIVKPHYDAWKQGQAVPETGTPLAAWNGATKQQIEILKAHSIYTVEDFAAVPDSILERLGMGMRDAREAARRFVAASDTREVASQMATMQAENEALKQQMADLMAAMQGGDDNPRRGPGRPRKDAEVAA
mgnify:CR=1 FL=1